MTAPVPLPPRLSRRSFLKLSAAGAAGWGLAPSLSKPAPRLAATLPVAFAHQYFPNPEVFLSRLPAGFDLLLVPAYIAAGLIRRHKLQPLAGPLGRAHDPEGAYTLPYRYAVSAVLHQAGAAPADPWQSPTAWPSFSRLLLGAALQRRGYSPNDTHAGHLAQASQDVTALSPAITADPLAALQAGVNPAALLPVPLTEAGELEFDKGWGASLPPWGGMLLEYDWVMPLNAPDPETALAFVQALPPAAPLPAGLPFVPLAPLPDRAQAQHTRLWADLTRVRREAGS
jgi:hypothetical protein